MGKCSALQEPRIASIINPGFTTGHGGGFKPKTTMIPGLPTQTPLFLFVVSQLLCMRKARLLRVVVRTVGAGLRTN